jgi:hypothetical protein
VKDTFETVVDKWISKITKIQSSNNYPICPYAKTARYHVYTHEDYMSMQLKAAFFDHKNYDLYICFPTNQFMKLDEAQRMEDDLNRASKDTIVMLDHWKNPGFIDGVNTSNDQYVLFLIQDTKGLIRAREHLKTTTYYDNWTEEYYKKITETGTTISY